MAQPSAPSEDDRAKVAEILKSLISGMPLNRVPEEIQPQLLIPLSAAKNEAVVAGNTGLVKRIQALMRSLKLDGTNSPQSKHRKPVIRSVDPSTIDSGSIENVIDDLLEGRPMSTVNDNSLDSLVSALKARKETSLREGDYHKSQIYENFIQDANSRRYEATYASDRNSRLSSLQFQISEAKEELQKSNDFWSDTKKQHEEKYAAEKKAMLDQQSAQIRDFDSSFPDVLPANYRKLSAAVLQLREQEKHLILSKRYEDAIPFRERADKMEQQELEVQREKFVKAFQTQKQQMVESHKTQSQCFEQNWARKFERLEQEKEQEVFQLNKTISNLQRKMDALGKDMSEERKEVTARSCASLLRPASQSSKVRTVAASRMSSRPHALSSKKTFN